MEIINGKEVAKSIRAEISEASKKAKRKIGLAVVLVGENPASQIYVRNKIKACEEVGFASFFVNLPESATQEEVIRKVKELNANPEVDGIIVQLPLPKGIDEYAVSESIDPKKDVDGCTVIQKGKLFVGEPELIACTPYGVIKMLEYYNIDVAGKNALIIGRSNLVGKPLFSLLLARNATVTLAHSKTTNLKELAQKADILCVAIGKPNFVTADMVKEGAVVIDVGINRSEEGLKGDVDYQAVKDKCSYITPVPGGVGPMTVTMLLYNTLQAYLLYGDK